MSLPFSFSPNIVRNTVKLMGPGASFIMSSISSFFTFTRPRAGNTHSGPPAGTVGTETALRTLGFALVISLQGIQSRKIQRRSRGAKDSREKMFLTVLFITGRQLEAAQTSDVGGVSYF